MTTADGNLAAPSAPAGEPAPSRATGSVPRSVGRLAARVALPAAPLRLPPTVVVQDERPDAAPPEVVVTREVSDARPPAIVPASPPVLPRPTAVAVEPAGAHEAPRAPAAAAGSPVPPRERPTAPPVEPPTRGLLQPAAHPAVGVVAARSAPADTRATPTRPPRHTGVQAPAVPVPAVRTPPHAVPDLVPAAGPPTSGGHADDRAAPTAPGRTPGPAGEGDPSTRTVADVSAAAVPPPRSRALPAREPAEPAGAHPASREPTARPGEPAVVRTAPPAPPPVHIGRIDVIVSAPEAPTDPFAGCRAIEAGVTARRGGGW